MLLENIFWIISIWVASAVIGVISWPTISFFFGRLSDRGYSISKILGWIILSYAAFLLVTLKLAPLSLATLIILLLAWTALNIFLEYRFKLLSSKKISWKQILLIETGFLLLMGFWAFVRAHGPEIHEVERFVEFGSIQALFNTQTLPLYDIWFLGENPNYYYFGHLISYSALSISNVPLIPGFFILIAWVFGLVGINVYRLGRDLFSLLKPKHLRSETLPLLAGALSVFSVLFAGTWHTVPWFSKYLLSMIRGIPVPEFGHWNATRVLPGTITEMPIFSFLEADLHAHMWGFLIGIIVIAILYALWIDRNPLNLKNKYLWIVSWMLGIAYMTNAWDAITLGTLTLLVGGVIFWKEPKAKLIAFGLLVPITAYITALPWSLFFTPPISGIGIVHSMSPFFAWLSFWGAMVFLGLLFVGRIVWLKLKNATSQPAFRSSHYFHLIVLLTATLWLILLEVFYLKDIYAGGEYFRVIGVFRVSLQVWLWIGILAGSMIVWLLSSVKSKKSRLIIYSLIVLLVLGQAIYPIITVVQKLTGPELRSLDSGLEWWRETYPYDYEAYSYLSKIKQNLPQNDKIRNIVEAEGDSYTDVSRFSVFLGWPTIIGWPEHEWGWRGDYDEVEKRISEVREIYTGEDIRTTQQILEKYAIDYLIIGEVEYDRYGDTLKIDKLAELGDVIFYNQRTQIIHIR